MTGVGVFTLVVFCILLEREASSSNAGFTVIGRHGYCVHRKGGEPSHCLRYAIDQTANWCEEFCSSYEPCVGYYGNFGDQTFCHLVTSNGKCPEPNEDPNQGFEFRPQTNTAESWKDLVAVYYDPHMYSTSICKGKQSKINSENETATSTPTLSTTQPITTTTEDVKCSNCTGCLYGNNCRFYCLGYDPAGKSGPITTTQCAQEGGIVCSVPDDKVNVLPTTNITEANNNAALQHWLATRNKTKSGY